MSVTLSGFLQWLQTHLPTHVQLRFPLRQEALRTGTFEVLVCRILLMLDQPENANMYER